MKTRDRLIQAVCLSALSLVAASSIGCATHERVVVHDRPEVVRVEAPPPPVVQERVVVRP